VLTVRLLTVRDVVASSESSRTVDAKSESVASWSRYDTAPLTAPQVNVTAVGRLEDPFPGDIRMGGAMFVLKFQTSEYGLVPNALVALTRQ
jgi:hypothetical protein